MKKNVLFLLIILLFTSVANSQRNLVSDKSKVTKGTISLPTLYCEQCAENVRNALHRLDGVLSFRINISAKELKVEYLTNRTTLNNIRIIINNAGYQADTLKPLQEHVDLLPICCRRPIPEDTVKLIRKIYRTLKLPIPTNKNAVCTPDCDVYYNEVIRNNSATLKYYDKKYKRKKSRKIK